MLLRDGGWRQVVAGAGGGGCGGGVQRRTVKDGAEGRRRRLVDAAGDEAETDAVQEAVDVAFFLAPLGAAILEPNLKHQTHITLFNVVQ